MIKGGLKIKKNIFVPYRDGARVFHLFMSKLIRI